jgi:D-alanyl-D-alanine carboxypeptidase
MNHTAYEGYERAAAPRAAGHTPAPGSNFGPSMPLSMTQPYAAGALVSTVDDLARWDAAVSSGKLLKPASWQQAFTPYALPGDTRSAYGYGWITGKVRGVPVLAHAVSAPALRRMA